MSLTPVVFLVGGWIYLGLEDFSNRPAPLANIDVVEEVIPAEAPPWSPPLETTNELTLDVRDAAVRISIDGRPYPVDKPGERRVRLGEGIHKIAVGDERGWFDEETVYTPTSESYLRIDRGGILRSSAPTNVQIEWIQAETGVSDLMFKGPDDVLIGRDASGRVVAWHVDSGQSTAVPADNSAFATEAMHAGSPDAMGDMGFQADQQADQQDPRTMAVTADGDFLAAIDNGDNGHVRLFDVSDPNSSNWLRQMVLTQHPDGIPEIAFSPDGRLLLCASEDRTEVFRLDGLIATEIGRITRPASGGALDSAPTMAAFLPDNRRVLLADKDGNVELWDARALRMEAAVEGDRFGRSPIDSIDFDRTGRRALIHYDKMLRVFDIERGEFVMQPPEGGLDRLTLARFLPDGRHCVLVMTDTGRRSRSRELQIADLETGRITARLNLHEALRAGTKEVHFHDLRISPDGRRITVACTMPLETVSRAVPWDVNPARMKVYDVQIDAIAVVTWAVPDDAFGSAPHGADGGGIEPVRTIKTAGPVASLDFTPDGTQFVSGGAVWTFPDGDIVHRLSADSRASRVAVSPEGKRIAEAHGSTLTLWDRETGERLLDTNLTATVQVQGQDVNLVQSIQSVAWSPDGGSLLIACPRPIHGQGEPKRVLQTGHAFLVRLDGETATIERRFQHRDDVRAAIFLGNGSRIVTACEDGGVRTWSADTGTLLHEHNSGGPVTALDATADGGYIAAGLQDGSVRVWETRYGHQVLRLDSSGHPITAVRLLPNESRLVAADTIGVLTLWDLDGASIIAQEVTESVVTALAVDPDGEHVLTAGTGSESSAIKLWRLPKTAD